MISDLVDEGKQEIDFHEFLDLMTQRVSNKDTKEDLRKVFALFDLDKSGYISVANLRAIMKDLGENIDEHELT
jgi:centrin-1